MNVAKVLVELSIDKCFDYHIPLELIDEIEQGSQVEVPFGRSIRSGFVVEIVAESDFQGSLAKIRAVVNNRTKIPVSLLKLSSWMAEYYCSPKEQALKTLLPSAVRSGKVKEKVSKFCRLNAPLPEAKLKSAKQQSIINILTKEGELPLNELALQAGCGVSVVRTLERNGYVTIFESSVYRSPFAEEVLPSTPLTPSPEQQTALELFDKIQRGETASKVMLLFGATNSGKTEVYLQTIAKVLAEGKSAIVLVPEIALTPQTVRRFRARFGDLVSVMHSKLTDAERFDQWNRISRGEVSIAIGARSALFAPFQNLGLIVVDEEHEGSYKQSEAPRYHARDVAVMRGKLEDATVILGSATPSFESYHNALNKRYELCRMKASAGSTVPPHWEIVDLRLTQQSAFSADEKDSEQLKSPLFSPMLINAIKERLERAEQVILFMNRRGFARQMMCEDCGYVAGCPDCSVTFTYHKREASLSCHMCGITIPAPEVCPQCGGGGIHYSGSGTEKIESMARAIFQNARVARMDSDTMRAADAHENTLDKLQRGEIDILIGTQMIAKGLHFPNITLAGVINADQGLYIPDFRAAERTFQLLTQVAGRSGRGDRAGEVYIQTFSPQNEAIMLSLNNDYEGFYEYDMAVRELLMYPPFGHMIILHFRSEEQELCLQCANECYKVLQPYVNADMITVDPMPSPVERIKGKFRCQILFRGRKLKNLRRKLRELAVMRHYNGKVDVYVDADPQSLM